MTDEDASTRSPEEPATDDAGGAAADESGTAGDAPTGAAADGSDPEAADDADGTESGDADGPSLDPTGTSLVAKVAIEDGDLAEDVEDHLVDLVAERETAVERAAEAEERVEDLESRLKRTQADFQNYKKRAERRREETRERATADLVERLLAVRDDLVRAVEDDHDDVGSLREGVELTLAEFDRVLDAEGVAEIAPEPGDEVDPQRHEVMLRVESDQPAETVADVHRSGFEMADTVLRPAQVTVSEGPADDGTAGDGGDAGDEGPGDGEGPADDGGEVAADDGEAEGDDTRPDADDGGPDVDEGE